MPAHLKLCPVGRAAQAVVCKTTYAGATPARDSISSGISVERHTPVFQTGIEGALPSCPSISQVNSVCRQRPRTVEVMAGCRVRTLGISFARREYRCRSGLHRPGCGGSTPPSCRDWAANFGSEVPALTRREHGANPWQPTISEEERGLKNPMRGFGAVRGQRASAFRFLFRFVSTLP